MQALSVSYSEGIILNYGCFLMTSIVCFVVRYFSNTDAAAHRHTHMVGNMLPPFELRTRRVLLYLVLFYWFLLYIFLLPHKVLPGLKTSRKWHICPIGNFWHSAITCVFVLLSFCLPVSLMAVGKGLIMVDPAGEKLAKQTRSLPGRRPPHRPLPYSSNWLLAQFSFEYEKKSSATDNTNNRCPPIVRRRAL